MKNNEINYEEFNKKFMERMKLIERNALICKFLGYEGRYLYGGVEKFQALDIIYGYYLGGEPNIKVLNGRSFCEVKEMRFNTSWDWLMPVYIKIVRLLDKDVDDEDCVILFNVLYDRLGDGDGIEEVFEYVCQWIESYNKIGEELVIEKELLDNILRLPLE
jgi:hypothetical protein